MPLILLSGYPSSGLTYRANQIIEHFTLNPPSISPSFKIVHISDDTLSIPRSAYDNARSEKDARAALSSAIKRNLGRETLVIADAMNYIKGFRYQMWCEAKAAGTGCCVVHVAANPEQATALHDRRIQPRNNQANTTDSNASENHTETSNGDLSVDTESNQTEPKTPINSQEQPPPPAYSSSTFQNLISRYEEPSPSARWDSPLFTVPYSDDTPPYEAISKALFSSGPPSSKGKQAPPSNQQLTTSSLLSTTGSAPTANLPLRTGTSRNGSVADSTTPSDPGHTPSSTTAAVAVAAASKPRGTFVKPHLATVAPKQMSSDALYILERSTTSILKAILAYLATSTAGTGECAGESITFDLAGDDGVSLVARVLTDDEEANGDGDGSENNGSVHARLRLSLPATGTLGVGHLQRLKRQFVSLYRSRGVGMGAASSGGKGALDGGALDEEHIRRAFVVFLQRSFDSEER